MSEARRSRRSNRNKRVSGCTSITSRKEWEEPNAIPSSQSSTGSNAAACASATKAPAPAAFVEMDSDISGTSNKGINSTKEVVDEEEERIQPDAIPSESSINGSSNSTRKQESGEVKHEDIRPCSVSSSSSMAAISTHPADANNSTKREKKKKTAIVAFVEKEFVVKEEPEEEEEEEGEGEGTAPLPETINSSDTTLTAARARQQLTTNHGDDNTNTNKDRVMVNSGDSLADEDTNNDQKRRNQGSRMKPIKSEELDSNDDSNSTKRTRSSSRRKRKQYPSDGGDFIKPNDNNLQTSKKTKRKNNQQEGGPAVVINNTQRTSPRRNKKPPKGQEEEDSTIDTNTNDDHTSTNNNNKTKNCCKLCNDPDWENKIYYKCGTVISKYFPISNNNPNPGWYKGTIRMHLISSPNSGSDSAFGSGSECDSDSEWEEEENLSNEEENEQQSIILNEIHYEDGDVENITQDDLKLQLMDSRNVKILHTTNIATVFNSERHDHVYAVPPATLSDRNNRDWLKIYGRLKQFKEENGHCRVPKNYGPDPSLANWVMTQRKTYKHRKLAEDRAEKLDKICFEWAIVTETPDQVWQEKFDRLIIFKADNGHCRVPPNNYGPDPALGNWVSKQRKDFKKGKMAADRAKKLNKIGFDWDPLHQTWDEMFVRLEQFKAENLHCKVPQRYDPDPLLGRWVSNQRTNHKKGKLAKDRAMKLEDIGFDWNPPNHRNRAEQTLD